MTRFATRPLWQYALALACTIAPLNSTMLAVALPSLRRDFDIGVGASAWLISSYLIAVAVCQPLAGRLGDRFGQLRVLYAGLAIVIVASIAAALTWTYELLVFTRALQGVGAALVMPGAAAFLRKQIPESGLGSALGLNGAVIAAAAAIGPMVAGLLLAAGDWRLLFLVNAPIVLLVWAGLRSAPRELPADRRPARIEPLTVGALLAAFVGVTLLGNRQVGSEIVVVGAVLLVTGLAVYGLAFARFRTGVVDLRLFRSSPFAAAAAGNALSNAVMYTMLISLPIYLKDVRGRSDLVIGLALFAMSGVLVAFTMFAGRQADRGGPRRLAIAGMVVLAAAAAAVALSIEISPLWPIVASLGLVGVGMGLLGAPLQTTALQSHDASQAGSASGTFQMMRYVGSVCGAALFAGMLGANPESGEFVALCWTLCGVAVVGIASAFALGPRRRRQAASTLPTSAGVRGG